MVVVFYKDGNLVANCTVHIHVPNREGWYMLPEVYTTLVETLPGEGEIKAMTPDGRSLRINEKWQTCLGPVGSVVYRTLWVDRVGGE